MDSLSLGTLSQTNATLQPLPSMRSLNYVATSTGAGVNWSLSRELRAEAMAIYQISGGADGQSRPSLPLQRGPQLTASLGLTLSRLDSLVTQLTFIHSEFTSEPRPDFSAGSFALASTAFETWRRAWGHGTESHISGGIGLAETDDPTRGVHMGLALFPAGEVGVRMQPVTPLLIGLTVRAAPFVDRLTGTAYERAEASADLAFSASRHLQLSAHGGVGQVVGNSPQRGDYLRSVDLGGTYAVGRDWRLAFGGRAAWQRVQGAPLTQWLVFAGAQFAKTERL